MLRVPGRAEIGSGTPDNALEDSADGDACL